MTRFRQYRVVGVLTVVALLVLMFLVTGKAGYGSPHSRGTSGTDVPIVTGEAGPESPHSPALLVLMFLVKGEGGEAVCG